MKHGIKKITAGIETLEAARALFEQNSGKLEQYIDELTAWNEKINLVSRTVSRETIREHVVHSLLPVSLSLLENHRAWIDAGTGGGLPGIPLAICEPDKTLFLNDNIRKKIRAVDDIVLSLKLTNTTTIPQSISLFDLQKGTGIVTKHAFKIPDLLRLLGSKPWKTIVLWKGINGAEEELTQSKKQLNCKIYEFAFGDDEPFYEGKGLVVIER